MISVVIPTCNRTALIEKCLAALTGNSQTLSEELYQITVSDDGNDDATKKLIAAKFPTVEWVPGPRKGPGNNRNSGARHAQGKWIVFIDDDCCPSPTLLQKYAEAIGKYPHVRAFEGAIHAEDWAMIAQRTMVECPVNTEGNLFWTANVCIERALFLQLGGFDEQFLYSFEDIDMLYRLREKSEVRFLPDAVVTHPVRVMTLGARIRKEKLFYQDWLAFCAKYHKKSMQVLREGYEANSRCLYRSMKQLKTKDVLFHLYNMFYLIPANFGKIRKLNRVS